MMTSRRFGNWVLVHLALFIMESGGVLMLQLKGLTTGVLLGKLQNKSAWLVSFFPFFQFLLVSVFFPVPDNLTNLFKILASFVHVYFSCAIFSFRGLISGMRPSNLLICTIQTWLPSMVLC